MSSGFIGRGDQLRTLDRPGADRPDGQAGRRSRAPPVHVAGTGHRARHPRGDRPAPPESRPHGDGVVGGYWTRTNDPEIDIVLADRSPVARQIRGVGSKWLENRPFDSRDLARLVVHRSQLPGADADTPLLAVSRSGNQVADLRALTPEDLLTAWPVSATGQVAT